MKVRRSRCERSEEERVKCLGSKEAWGVKQLQPCYLRERACVPHVSRPHPVDIFYLRLVALNFRMA